MLDAQGAMLIEDELTGLINRPSFIRELNTDFEETDCRILLLVDADNFRSFAYTHGEDAADSILRMAADRMARHACIVGRPARIDGNTFALVIASASQEMLPELAHLLLCELKKPYAIGGNVHIQSFTGGYCVLPERLEDASRYIQQAEIALCRARASAPGTIEAFTAGDEEGAKRRHQLRASLKRAIALEEFSLVYQPIIDLQTNEITKVEALIRWCNGGEWVSPLEFVTLAEQEGLIHLIGDWVLRKACRAASQLPCDIQISVNVSPKQLESGWIMASVEDALKDSGLAAERLILEITEQVMVADCDRVREYLQQVRGLGVQIALDDFGTGYSALSYLADYPLDILKIDRSLLTRSCELGTSLTVLRHSIALARDLGLQTTVEGVECSDEAMLCAHLGANTAQGYYFCRPVPIEDLMNRIAESRNFCPAAA